MTGRITDIAEHPFFDQDWYLDTYPDVAASGIAPATHYARYGSALGRNPGPEFSVDLYRRAHGGTGADALTDHDIRFGRPDAPARRRWRRV